MSAAFAVSMTATSADAELLSTLRSQLSGRVHSVFRTVINIAPYDGDLWCFATRAVPLGPCTVVTDRDSFDPLAIRRGTLVDVDGAFVRLGRDVVLRLDTATAWCPRQVCGPVHHERVLALAEVISRLAVPGGATPGADSFSIAVADRVATGLAAFETAVQTGDSVRAEAAAASLIGLGAGLTPTGDDVLTGLAYAAATLGGPLDIIPSAVARATTSQATNMISLVALRYAVRGRAHQYLIDMLDAICGAGSVAAVVEATARLVTIGHTSGTDQAHGLYAAVHLIDETRRNAANQLPDQT